MHIYARSHYGSYELLGQRVGIAGSDEGRKSPLLRGYHLRGPEYKYPRTSILYEFIVLAEEGRLQLYLLATLRKLKARVYHSPWERQARAIH